MPEQTDTDTAGRVIYQVSELNAAVRELLEHSFPLLWVEGEVSNLAKPRSGHWYFTLKDDNAQVRCAMFRGNNRLLGFTPEDGMQVLVRAKVGLYAVRGDYQLVVQHLEAAGDGALRRAFDQLKQRLATEGLFDEAAKRALPALPRRIGVITSATGAAWRDVLSVLQRRFPLGRVLLHAVPVQGQAAAPAIVRALDTLGSRHGCDLILLVRGGGSLEDLWAFNEETVARAIRACPIPVVTGVGHETDFTIADFAADLRAPTPSAAAERACPDQSLWQQRLLEQRERLAHALYRRIEAADRQITVLRGRLQRLHPERGLQQRMQRLDELESRLQRSMLWGLERRGAALKTAVTGLEGNDPRLTVRRLRDYRARLHERLAAAARRRLDQADNRWRIAGRGLQAVSPLRTLERGYAIVESEHGAIVTDAAAVVPGEALRLTLRHGGLGCRVTERLPSRTAGPAGDHGKV